ncbi:GNAT family N-acetyltransferase [Microbacterium sp. ASV49]|uniref:GNAT family protein n=1 Tax=Microbacterium candidum TaxID=3041922 RepID=A0ABT7MXP3_9MICO|nr:GNAT family protein [Microbacterium sp. ASV49]MDL9979224.1 GNAT family protein [Microbacterium sp. ASV49]
MDPLTAVPWPLRTERLAIRRATADDVEATWVWRSLPEVGEWITRAPADIETYAQQFTDEARLPTMLVVALEDPAEPERRGRLIGDVMLRIEDGWAQAEVAEAAQGTQAELGWTLDPALQGRGYATEGIRAVIGACFGPLGLRRIHAGCFAANEPSWRVMERLGMRREEFSRGTGLHRSGVWMDGLNYGLLAEEWSGAADGSRRG